MPLISFKLNRCVDTKKLKDPVDKRRCVLTEVSEEADPHLVSGKVFFKLNQLFVVQAEF